MVAFVVSVNGRRVCVAGVGGSGVLGAHVSWFMRPDRPDSGELQVGGLDTVAREHLDWPVPVKLQVGDTVSVQAVELDAVDPPAERTQGGR